MMTKRRFLPSWIRWSKENRELKSSQTQLFGIQNLLFYYFHIIHHYIFRVIQMFECYPKMIHFIMYFPIRLLKTSHMLIICVYHIHIIYVYLPGSTYYPTAFFPSLSDLTLLTCHATLL